MAANTGMTNSGAFYNGHTRKFDIERCFNERANRIKYALKDMLYFYDHPEEVTEDYVKFIADQLSDEFFTILKVALEWEHKEFKK